MPLYLWPAWVAIAFLVGLFVKTVFFDKDNES